MLINNIPIQFTGYAKYYIDADNGDDETGDGTEEKPYRTWAHFTNALPSNTLGWCDIHVTGNFGGERLQFALFGTVNVYFDNDPIVAGMDFAYGTYTLYGSVTVNTSAYDYADYALAVLIYSKAYVQYINGTMTINSSKSPKVKCIDIASNAILWLQYWNEGFIRCNNGEVGLLVESFGNFADQYGSYGSMISYSGCDTDIVQSTGGTIARTQW